MSSKDAYAFRVEEKGRHLVKRDGRGFPIELPTELLAEQVAQALCRAHQQGREEVQAAIKTALGIEECQYHDD